MNQRALRVVHIVCSDGFAGVERSITYSALGLSELGHQITVIGGRGPLMRAALGPSGIAHHPGDSPAQALSSLVRMGRSEHAPDLIHAHMTEAELVAVAGKVALRRPVVATRHFARPRGGEGWRHRLYQPVPHFLDRQVAISSFVAEATRERCTVVPHGLPFPEVTAEIRQPVVLVAQRLEPEKETAAALRIWARSGLPERGWTLEIAGEGRQAQALHQLADDLGIATSVRFLGFVDDLAARLASASLFLATTPADGFGLSVVEAMGAGVVVVATASGGHLETVGSVAPELLYESLEEGAELLASLVEDQAVRRRWSATLLARTREQYSLGRHAQRLSDLYEEVLGSLSAR